MNRADISVMLIGLKKINKAMVKLKNDTIGLKTERNALRTLEMKATSTFLQAVKPGAISNVMKEVTERSNTIIEGLQQYAIHAKSSQIYRKNLEGFEISHPIINTDEILSETNKEANNFTNTTPSAVYEKPVSIQQHLYDKPNETNKLQVTINNSTVEPRTTEQKSQKFKLSNQEIHEISKSYQPEQKLNDRARERKVPSTKASRLFSYGTLAAGIGVGVVAEVARRGLGLSQGSDSNASSLLDRNPFLSEANANRIVDTLCKVRGAALKLGQMLSLQDNAMINPQLAAVFERVRQSADFMPYWQMEKVLVQELGADWQQKFSDFEKRPFAAASIGQVHRGVLHDGTQVALKIQYPGVAESIENDIRSLLGIINLWNILPRGLYLENMMAVAKRELKLEVDYTHEANASKKFEEFLKFYPQYIVPKVYDDLSTRNILTTELIYGRPVDTLIDTTQDVRNMVGKELLRLCLMEVFLFKFMQTDPNWSNFFYNQDTGKIALLDFGASRSYSPEFVDGYLNIIKAASDQQHERVFKISQELGFLTGYETKAMEKAHVDAVMILGEAFACKEPFDFGKQSMTHRIHHLVPIMLEHRLTPPPEETYSLHRKLSGIFLLCTKLKAIIDSRSLFNDVYEKYCENQRLNKP